MPIATEAAPRTKETLGAGMVRIQGFEPPDVARARVTSQGDKPRDLRDGLWAIPPTRGRVPGLEIPVSSNGVRAGKLAVAMRERLITPHPEPITPLTLRDTLDADAPAVPEFPFDPQAPVQIGPFRERDPRTDEGVAVAEVPRQGKITIGPFVLETHPLDRGSVMVPTRPPNFLFGENLFFPQDTLPTMTSLISLARRYMDETNTTEQGENRVSKRNVINHFMESFVSREPAATGATTRHHVAEDAQRIDAETFYRKIADQSQEPVRSADTGKTYSSPKTLENVSLWLEDHINGTAPEESKFFGADRPHLYYEAAARLIDARWTALDALQKDLQDPIDPQTHLPASSRKKEISAKETAARRELATQARPRPTEAAQGAADRTEPTDGSLPEHLIVAGHQLLRLHQQAGMLTEGSVIRDPRVSAIKHALDQHEITQDDPDFRPGHRTANPIIEVLASLGIDHRQLIPAPAK